MSVASFLLPAQTPPSNRVPFEGYYEAEQRAETRSEFIDGVVRSMAGAAPDHILIVASLGDEIGSVLRSRGSCRLLRGDTQIPIPGHNVYAYPDAVIACPPRFATRPRDALLNPKVVFEVLSPSTEGYDREDKFLYYRSLESFEEYVLVSVGEPKVEVFRLRNGWEVQTYEGLDTVARLESVGLDLALGDLYQDVEFTRETTD